MKDDPKPATAYIAISGGKKPRTDSDVRKATGFKMRWRAVQLTTQIFKLEIAKNFLDHSSYAQVNWFNRHKFHDAVNYCIENNNALIIYDLVGMLIRCSKNDLYEHLRMGFDSFELGSLTENR